MILTAATFLFLWGRVDFRKEVKPILERHCVRCHGEDRPSRGLRLHTKERALMALVKKKPDESRIYNAAKSGFMPPGPNKLSADELATLRKWIQQGAKWPDGLELRGINPFVSETK